MGLSLMDAATLMAEEMKNAVRTSKVETVKEFKVELNKTIENSLGSGSKAFKALSEAIFKEVSQRIPAASVFTSDRGQGYDPESGRGFKSMSREAIKDLELRVLSAVLPKGLQQNERAFPIFEGGKKAMSVGTGSSGGFTLPEEFVAEVQRKLVHKSTFLGQARVWSGVDMIGKMPRETGTVSVTIAGELVTPSNTQPSLGQITWALQKRIGLTNLPKELFRFSGIDILNLLSTMFAEQFQKIEDYYYMNGTGSQQPMGLLTQTTGMNSNAIASSSLLWQDLVTLKHSIKSQYRVEKDNCAYMMNNNSIALVSKLTDDQNRPVFQDRGPSGLASGDVPAQTVAFIEGYPVLENPYTPGPVAENISGTVTSTATTSTIVFANFQRGYGVFKGPAFEVSSSDIAYDAFINDGLYVKAIDFLDGKPNIPEAVGLLTGVK